MEQQSEKIYSNNLPDLAELIRDNINYQYRQSARKTILKESLLKQSLDKSSPSEAEERTIWPTHNLLQATEPIHCIYSWLHNRIQSYGIAYLPYTDIPRFLHIIHYQIEGTIIVISQYSHFWTDKMADMSRLSKLRWAVLTAQLEQKDKVNILQLYELKQLKLLFIAPSLFYQEDFHHFQSSLLLILDLHLYKHAQLFLQTIIQRASSNRTIGIYNTLFEPSYQMYYSNGYSLINSPNTEPFILMVLKTTPEEKFKSLTAFTSKVQYNKTLVIVQNKNQAISLQRKFLLESKSSYNIFEGISASQLRCFNSPQIFQKTDKSQEKILGVLRKSMQFEVVISSESDFLKFGGFDLVVFYSFADKTKFIQSCPTAPARIMLFVEQDYFRARNQTTADLLNLQHLQPIVKSIMQRTKRSTQRYNYPRKRLSQQAQQRRTDCYSGERNSQKAIKINEICRRFDITPKTLERLIEILSSAGVISFNCKIVSQIQIDSNCLTNFRKVLPNTPEVRRRVQVLTAATFHSCTTNSILEQLKRNGIKFKVVEETIHLKVLKNFDELQWTNLLKMVNQPILDAAKRLDSAYATYREHSYSSIQLTKRERILQRKKYLLKGQTTPNPLVGYESCHKNSVLSSQVQQWIRHNRDARLSEHEVILLVQGVERGRIKQFREQPLFGRYKKSKYENLQESVAKIFSHKKIKIR